MAGVARFEGEGLKLPSVHLAEFPVAPTVFANPDLHRSWEYLFQVRKVVQGALEKKRRDKVIGSSLEGKVVLQATEPQCGMLKRYLEDLPALFIVSCVAVEPISKIVENDQELVDVGLGLSLNIMKAEGVKCDRCWNIRNDVGVKAEHPTICGRCVEALA